MKTYTKRFNNIIVLSMLFLCGCVDGKITLPFPLDPNGLAEIPSHAEVCNARKALTSSSPDIQKSSDWKYWLFFEGTLLDAHTLPKQKQEISFEINKVMAGNTNPGAKQISIISPMEKFGGIPVVVGEKYKVLALRLDGKYYSWAASGTAPKDPVFSGFYGCDK